jgi:hypothetical protein
MGWSLCMATERDAEGVTWLDRHFSYELLQDGCLQAFLTGEEVEILARGWIDDPDEWIERDPGPIGYILKRVRSLLHERNGQLPIHHFLWFVDKDGKRWGGGTQTTIPFGGIEYTDPHDPMIKLDGGHGDLEHRNELKRFNVRIDPILLDQFQAQMQRHAQRLGIKEGESFTVYGGLGEPMIDPLIKEEDGWLPVEPVLNILGDRIEVQSEDALAMLGPDLDLAIEFCDRARAEGLPLFWLSG